MFFFAEKKAAYKLLYKYLNQINANFAISALQNGIIVLILHADKCIWRRFLKHIII